MSAGTGRAEQPDAWAEVEVDGPETVAEQRLMAAFALRARATNLARALRLGELFDDGEDGSLDEAGRREAENLAHQVVGSAGTFGHPAASLDAARVERFFADRAPVPERPQEERERVRATLVRLRVELGGQP